MDIGKVGSTTDFEHDYWRSAPTVEGRLARLEGGIPSDDEFRLLAENVPTLCWIANGDGYIVWYNRRWHEYCGTTPEEMEGWGWQSVHDADLLPEVMERWTSSIATGHPFEMTFPLRGADGTFRPFLTRIQPVRDESGEIVRWFGVNTEITVQIAAEQALRESESRFRAVFDSAAVGMLEIDSEWNITRANEAFSRISGYSIEELLGRSSLAFTHPDDIERSKQALETVSKDSDGHAAFEKRYIRKDGQEIWIRSNLSRLDRSGPTRRYLKIVEDITAERAAHEALRAGEQRLRLIQTVGRIGSFDYDLQKDVVFCSDEYYEIMGIPPGTQIDLDYAKRIVHPDDLDDALAALDKAIADRQSLEHEYRIIRPDNGEVRWVASNAAMILDDSGQPWRYVGGIRDITDRKLAAEALRESEERLRLVSDSAPGGLYAVDTEGHTTFTSRGFMNMIGFKDESEVLGRKLHDLIHHSHPNGSPYDVSDCPIYNCAKSGEKAYVADEIFFRLDGTTVPVEYWVAPIRSNGRHVGATCTIVDLTERKKAEQALFEESRRLETLNRTGAALAGELELEKVVQMVTDAGVELTGAQFGAFFYNVINPVGESYYLYALSGADREQFDKFGMPRATKVFEPTFKGEGVVRSDDITKDERYGKNKPYNGMPKGHLPVRSYLAVPVIGRTGEVIGGLFFGHPKPGRFTERHENLMTGIAAQAAVAIDNARLYQSVQSELSERARAETALRELNETLEQRVNEEIERRSEAESALRQAQKMETLGQLTGGIAHDFNNLLQVIAGNLDILKRKLPEDQPRLQRAAENALTGASRAATLTQRLLAFSRRQPLAPKPTDINRLVATMSQLLHRTLGELIEVESVLAPRLWAVEVDPNQLENAIINLAVNARDAMPEGGKLTIETQNTHLDESYVAKHPEIDSGQYVMICISDTGRGMDDETLSKAVEPFFTTKVVGKGTGLGLSMVYGFVKQSSGHLRIYSEPEEGTTVKIYLPRLVGDVVDSDETESARSEDNRGEETILVCEDDDEVRAYSVEVLRELGYRVLEAHDGPSALRLLERQDGPVHLLFTDVVLPGGMSGAVLAERAREIRPDLKTLFTTGYARNAIVHHGRLDPGVELITKPFSYSELGERIRDILDRR